MKLKTKSDTDWKVKRPNWIGNKYLGDYLLFLRIFIENEYPCETEKCKRWHYNHGITAAAVERRNTGVPWVTPKTVCFYRLCDLHGIHMKKITSCYWWRQHRNSCQISVDRRGIGPWPQRLGILARFAKSSWTLQRHAMWRQSMYKSVMNAITLMGSITVLIPLFCTDR